MDAFAHVVLSVGRLTRSMSRVSGPGILSTFIRNLPANSRLSARLPITLQKECVWLQIPPT